MALKMNVSFKNIPSYVKVILSVIPALIIALIIIFLFLIPKQKEIKSLEQKISAQENEIAKDQAKAAKLPELTLESEKLRMRLNELKLQLPEEKEVSTLLKQVSELCIGSGLKIALWKPEQKKTHASGIVYEIPVKVDLSGSYHSLGYFFSSLTKLNRIVNISDIKISDPKPEKENALDKISFTATTFSIVPEEEIEKKQANQQ
ncbi:MAG TPA: type 4a pilus biogenesis protein PilO [Thermodesulfovibrionales bacterium]|jgi:type IV pilus assembly protein PilO|nr:type 4a pilus biogenesis protein PilO [Thermodesulfovibrionales bacterium]